jgi:uncharacterized protein (UPF0335 family)/ribosome modulation factor
MPRHKGSKDKMPRKSRSAPTSNGPVSIDHNLPAPAPLTDDQNAALLIQGVGKIEALLEKQAETTSSIRIIRKSLKAEGFDKPVVDYALYLRKTQPEVAEELHRQQLKVARWLAHPIGTQSSFDLDLELPIDRAFLDGRAAGMEGVAATVPPKFSVSNEASNRWLEGWHAGQAALMSNIKTLQKEDDDADDYEETPFYEDNDPLEGIP